MRRISYMRLSSGHSPKLHLSQTRHRHDHVHTGQKAWEDMVILHDEEPIHRIAFSFLLPTG